MNDSGSHVLSQLIDSGKVSTEDEFLKFTDGKTIEQIKDMAEKSFYVVLGTIKFIPSSNEWWYPGCKCSKKVYPDENMYFCESCNQHVVFTSPKFRLQVRVMNVKDSFSTTVTKSQASGSKTV